MKSLLIFIPSQFDKSKPGHLLGKIVYDDIKDVKKFYIIGAQVDVSGKNKTDVLGYFSGTANAKDFTNKKSVDWINLYVKFKSEDDKLNYNYCLNRILINNRNVSVMSCHVMIIIYDQLSLLQLELCISLTSKNHFLELQGLLKKKLIQNEIKRKTMFDVIREFVLTNLALFFYYPFFSLSTVMNFILPILKYSTLGLHLNEWLENFNWMLKSIIKEKRITIKSGNHISSIIVDVILGILMLRIILMTIKNVAPSLILLDNADKVVVSLKQLVNWLMGSPAGLKLNRSFNEVLGKFFLYHIHLWWTFLTVLKPLLDFAFEVVLLFGCLGVTFQISIIADLLALLSFHSYCIYVYAARLFNIQLRGLTALFRLFLGKKKNPLRERIDSCEYQADQLFVGTLLFTILLFLMPTTWVYYSVFTTLRLIMISIGGTLTRLRFYIKVIPIYTFLTWIFQVNKVRNSINVSLYQRQDKIPITLISRTIVSSWSETWKQCIPDVIQFYPSIEWNSIIKNIIWGELIYPL